MQVGAKSGSWYLMLLVLSLVSVALFSRQALAEKPDTQGWTLVSEGKVYTYTGKAPSSRYPDDNLDKLTNGAIGSTSIRDPQWVGFYATEPVKILIDLERSVAIDRILLHHYAGTGGVAWPGIINVRASDDGSNWSFPVSYKFSEGYPDGATLRWFSLNDVDLEGHFVEIEVIWTEEVGGSQNIFISEIEVYTR